MKKQPATKAAKRNLPAAKSTPAKRSSPDDLDTHKRTAKKQKTKAVLNHRPTEILDVFVCGEGESGELGLGAHQRHGKRPVGVKSPRLNDLLDASAVGVVQMSAGGLHSAALTSDSKVFTWGVNDNGALGRNTDWEGPSGSEDSDDEDDLGMNPLETTPAAVSSASFGDDASSIVQVAATDSATFVLTSSGSVYGWGAFQDSKGTLGFSTAGVAKNIKHQTTPALVPNLKNITTIAAGGNHVLALNSSGAVHAWGVDEQHQLGHRSYHQRSKDSLKTKHTSLTPSPVFLPGRKIVAINCGAYHSFAVDDKGNVYAWGLNNFGQTGVRTGAGTDGAVVELPTRVDSLASYGVRDVSGGNHHSIACCKDGTILVWGRCDDSQMGISLEHLSSETLLNDDRGRPRILLMPTPVPDITGVFVAAGIDHSVAITEDGKAFSWGFSANYRTGLRTEDSVKIPTLIENSTISQRKLVTGACGGQFLLLAGPAVYSNGV